MGHLLDTLYQHGSTLAAADAEARQSPPGVVPLQDVQQVQDDPGAARPNRVTDCYFGVAVFFEGSRKKIANPTNTANAPHAG